MTLTIEDIRFSYVHTNILNGISLSVPTGTVTSILGPNGAGKSTLAKIVARIYRPSSGSIDFNGSNILTIPRNSHAKIVAYVPQSSPVPFELSVQESVLLGRTPYVGLRPKQYDYDVVNDAIRALGLDSLRERHLSELSGGQAQRALIARALAQEPQVLLLDEPTSALDLRYQVETLELIRKITVEQGLSTIIVIHDLNLASAYSDDVALLDGGRIVFDGRPEDVFEADKLSGVYGLPVTVESPNGYREVKPLSLQTAKQRLHRVEQ